MNEGSETFRVVWDGDSETDCVEACRELQLAAIEYRVSTFSTTTATWSRERHERCERCSRHISLPPGISGTFTLIGNS